MSSYHMLSYVIKYEIHNLNSEKSRKLIRSRDRLVIGQDFVENPSIGCRTNDFAEQEGNIDYLDKLYDRKTNDNVYLHVTFEGNELVCE